MQDNEASAILIHMPSYCFCVQYRKPTSQPMSSKAWVTQMCGKYCKLTVGVLLHRSNPSALSSIL